MQVRIKNNITIDKNTILFFAIPTMAFKIVITNGSHTMFLIKELNYKFTYYFLTKMVNRQIQPVKLLHLQLYRHCISLRWLVLAGL